MTLTDWVVDNLALILGVLAFAVFVVGLVFALRTEGGRNTLAGAAVSVALAALALAERWIGTQLKQDRAAAVGDTAAQENEIETARRWLRNWQARR